MCICECVSMKINHPDRNLKKCPPFNSCALGAGGHGKTELIK